MGQIWDTMALFVGREDPRVLRAYCTIPRPSPCVLPSLSLQGSPDVASQEFSPRKPAVGRVIDCARSGCRDIDL